MQSKEDMRKAGIKSPDLIDAMSFVFLEGATYMVAGGAASEATNLTEAVLDKAEDMFADVE